MAHFVTIHTFLYPQDAYPAKSYLESEGIHVFLKDELTTQVNNFMSHAIGGVKLQVPESESETAKKLLIEAGFCDERTVKEEKPEILVLTKQTDINRCPYCGSEEVFEEKSPTFLLSGFISWLEAFSLLPLTQNIALIAKNPGSGKNLDYFT